jgi:hypothetical protein
MLKYYKHSRPMISSSQDACMRFCGALARENPLMPNNTSCKPARDHYRRAMQVEKFSLSDFSARPREFFFASDVLKTPYTI